MCLRGCPAFVDYRRYAAVKVGMTLPEVEAILGPGREIAEDNLRQPPAYVEPDPEKRRKFFVKGDRFFLWQTAGGVEVYVGFKGDRVFDKWRWVPSL
jgi:hypothetical protein